MPLRKLSPRRQPDASVLCRILRPLAALPLLVLCLTAASQGDETPEDIALIKPQLQTRFSNGGWRYDRYDGLQTLDAHARITVADLKGPGVIRHIHTTRHPPVEICARGVVLEIWFDNAEKPSVSCPLADFFGDGCNGKAIDFTSKLIECAPGAYNSYFTMPFKSRARVYLRNDTNTNLQNYSYVEWEPLPKWDERLGYFHATYIERCFQLTPKSSETFLELKGAGHLLGRQLSVITDEPLFRHFSYVMEGNNEVDIDGEERRVDYLGTEDSFTFSWGFQQTFAGTHAGMPFVSRGEGLNQVSLYRFHDHMPIRFNNSLKWTISWQNERMFINNPEWKQALEKGNCWVDYAGVFYWYQKVPGTFSHQPLQPSDQRAKTQLPSKKASEAKAPDGK